MNSVFRNAAIVWGGVALLALLSACGMGSEFSHPSQAAPLQAPRVQVAFNSLQQSEVRWEAMASASGYRAYYSPDAQLPSGRTLMAALNETHFVPPHAVGETVYVAVSALWGTREGPRSEILTVSSTLAKVSITDISVGETVGKADVVVSLDHPSEAKVDVDYATYNDSAMEPGDYTSKFGTLSFDVGETSKTIAIDVKNDNTYERSEKFYLRLTSARGATLIQNQAVVTIEDDESEPQIVLSDVSVAEATGKADVVITLDHPSAFPVSVNYSTSDGTATSPGDYAAIPNNSLNFSPGEMSKTVSVNIVEDKVPETDEGFTLAFSSAIGAALAKINSIITIQNDDFNPVAPILTFDGYGYKQLKFKWGAATGATYYRFYENIDGKSGYVQYGGDISATSYALDVGSFFTRLSASYLLEACNNFGCTVSDGLLNLSNFLSGMLGSFAKAGTAAYSYTYLGTSVAVSVDGKTMAIGGSGSWNRYGVVSIFYKSSVGWTLQSTLMAPNLDIGFGGAVALSMDGNTLAVGASSDDGTYTNSGAVYMYTRSGTSWSQPVILKALNLGADDAFGISVALSADGNLLAVGAYFEDSNTIGVDSTANELASNSGAVYIFSRSGNAWGQQAYIKKAKNVKADDYFGRSVALSRYGDTLVVGAPSTPLGVSEVSVYTHSGSSWLPHAQFASTSTGLGDQFGWSVAISSDGVTLVVGAPGEDSSTTVVNSVPNELADGSGAAYVFVRNGANWDQQAYIKASNAGSGDSFGASIAMSSDPVYGDWLVVGAPREDSSTTGFNSTPNESASNSGAVYVFGGGGSSWNQTAYIKATNAGAGDEFGSSVAIVNQLMFSNGILAIGAPYEDSALTGIIPGTITETAAGNGSIDSGAVYLY